MKHTLAILLSLLLALSLTACQKAETVPDVDEVPVTSEGEAQTEPEPTAEAAPPVEEAQQADEEPETAAEPEETPVPAEPQPEEAPAEPAAERPAEPEYLPLPALWPPVVTEEGNTTVYACTKLDIPIPTRFVDLMIIESDPDQTNENSQTLLAFSEKASVEAAQLDYPGEDTGFGWLCSIRRLDQIGYEEWLLADIPGETLFATDDAYYYIHSIPTDVTFYRAGGEIGPESEGVEDYAALLQWSYYNIVPDILQSNPSLTPVNG